MRDAADVIEALLVEANRNSQERFSREKAGLYRVRSAYAGLLLPSV
nr:MAG TPA: hypothetical protein [Caudoviricetes sp.]